MDRFGKEEFRQLLEVSTEPAISMYMPTSDRQEMTFKTLRLQFRAHVDQAAEKLKQAEEIDPADYEPLLERLREMVDDRSFWNRTGDGVAVFMAPGFEAVYFLPVRFEGQCVVGHNFHTRPLLEHIAAPTDYWVLAIGEKEVTFWEGTPTGVEAVVIEDLPTSLQEALMLESEPDQDGINFRTGANYSTGPAGTGVGNQGGGRGNLPSPIFHGHGGGKEEHNAYLRQYFSEVSQGIQEYLGGAEGPLILAAVDYCHPIFRQVSKLTNLAEESIEGNVHFWNDKSIYEAAWPIAKQELEKRVETSLGEWERAFGRGAAELDPTMVARRTVEGRVHRLLLDEEARMWGDFDRTTGAIKEIHDGEEGASMRLDVFDEIAETVVQHGGEVVVLPREKMPGETGIGAILRGNGA